MNTLARGILCLLVAIFSIFASGDGFSIVTQSIQRRSSPFVPVVRLGNAAPGTSEFDLELPTIDQLSSDPFIKQVDHGVALTNQLLLLKEGKQGDDEAELLVKSIQAQLGHSDGIRGFMVSYLTVDESPADDDEIPGPLLQALLEQLDSPASKDLIPLTCMNVVMPTAMVSMHEDATMSESSARTATRGMRILQALNQKDDQVGANVKAILEAAGGSTSETADSELIQYWTDFFEKWGYGETQKEDIAKAMRDLLS